jgi:hypothetical protein
MYIITHKLKLDTPNSSQFNSSPSPTAGQGLHRRSLLRVDMLTRWVRTPAFFLTMSQST